MTGQGWVEHRSKVRSAGAGAERVGPVVPEDHTTRGCMSRRGQHSSPPRTHPPLPNLPTPNPPPARTQQQRGLWAQHPSGHGGLSELSGPKALAGPAGEGWAELRGAGRAWARSCREAGRTRGGGQGRQKGGSRERAWSRHVPWAHGLAPPRVLGPEQGQKTGSRHGKRAKGWQRGNRGAGKGRREREDTVRDGPRAEGDSGQKSPRPHPGPPSPTPCSDLGPTETQLPGEAIPASAGQRSSCFPRQTRGRSDPPPPPPTNPRWGQILRWSPLYRRHFPGLL